MQSILFGHNIWDLLWAKNSSQLRLKSRWRHWNVRYGWGRAGEGVHQVNKPDAARVQPGEDQAVVPGQDSPKRPQAQNREEIVARSCCLIQQSQKVIAQQILKNNQMVQKYNNLDAQLQNVTFE